MMPGLFTLFRDRRGNVAVLMAGGMTTLIGFAALAVDVGSLYLERRQLQGAADAAVLAAASAEERQSAARSVLDDNGLADAEIVGTENGQYTPDIAIPVASRFVAAGAGGNALRLTVRRRVPLFLGRFLTGNSTADIQVQSMAARVDLASFSIGSRLAAVGDGLPGALLSAIAGTDLHLSVMDYRALASADVDVLSFINALRTRADLQAVTFDDILNSDVALPLALRALGDAVVDSATRTVLQNLAGRLTNTKVRIGRLIDLGPIGGEDRADPDRPIRADSYSLVREMLQLANGQRQVQLDLGISAGALASTTAMLAIGERPAHSPWLTVARDGAVTVRTAQARLYISATLGQIAPSITALHVPIYVELAQASAKLAAISCTDPREGASVALDVVPAVGEVAIAEVDTASLSSFGKPVALQRAVIAGTPLLEVTGYADVALGGVTSQRVQFSPQDIAAGTLRTVSTGDISQALASSLIGGLDLRVSLLGLGLNVSGITALVGTALGGVAPTLDATLSQLTGLLGVHLGEADVRVDGVRCGAPMLVG